MPPSERYSQPYKDGGLISVGSCALGQMNHIAIIAGEVVTVIRPRGSLLKIEERNSTVVGLLHVSNRSTLVSMSF